MADRNLNFFSFLLERQTSGDATLSNPDPIGFFYARASTVRFFDIARFAVAMYKKTRSGYERVTTLADGTNLGAAQGNTIQVDEHPFTIKAKARPTGGQKIVLVTGKPTRQVTPPARANYHTVSFNFPRWATNLVISDALATIIPDANIRPDPGANDIFPYFIMPSGARVPIMTAAAASSDNTTNVGMENNVQEILSRNDAEEVETQDSET